MSATNVLACGDPGMHEALADLLARYGLELFTHPSGQTLPGSWWGDPEAGIIGHTVHVRPDTPVHSALHEAGHLICMDAERRAAVHTDAGGSELEECGVCYLQILLGDALPGVGHERMMRDMDAWGYSFRLGSTAAWFRDDADDARAFLLHHGLLDPAGNPVPTCRDATLHSGGTDFRPEGTD